jgi:hypothetical protein
MQLSLANELELLGMIEHHPGVARDRGRTRSSYQIPGFIILSPSLGSSGDERLDNRMLFAWRLGREPRQSVGSTNLFLATWNVLSRWAKRDSNNLHCRSRSVSLLGFPWASVNDLTIALWSV